MNVQLLMMVAAFVVLMAVVMSCVDGMPVRFFILFLFL